MAAWRQLGGVRLGVCACVAFAACASAPTARAAPRAAVATPAPSSAPVRAAGAPDLAPETVVSPDVVAVEELLAMAAVLAEAEAHADALHALERSEFAADLSVAMARADLLRDLGRRHDALAAMRGVRERLGAAAIDPRVLYELAELERLEGERAAARRTIAAIRELHGDAAWTRANSARLAIVDGQLAAAEPIRAMSARDLLGNLRGAPEPAERLAALQALLAVAGGETAEAAAVRDRAVAIAVGDDAETVRLAGVEAWTFDASIGRDFVALALADESPRIRRAAVAHAGQLPPSDAVPLLFDRLRQEDDAAVFLALHDGLRAASNRGVAITPLDAATAAGRAAMVDRWRQEGLAMEAR